MKEITLIAESRRKQIEQTNIYMQNTHMNKEQIKFSMQNSRTVWTQQKYSTLTKDDGKQVTKTNLYGSYALSFRQVALPELGEKKKLSRRLNIMAQTINIRCNTLIQKGQLAQEIEYSCI